MSYVERISCFFCGAGTREHVCTVPNNPGGWPFKFDGRDYVSPAPSMLAHEIKKLVDDDRITYGLFRYEQGVAPIPFADYQAVDLTQRPHLTLVPPCGF